MLIKTMLITALTMCFFGCGDKDEDTGDTGVEDSEEREEDEDTGGE